MNIKTPLAAALLMTSTAAMAQFFGPPEDDMIFKCGTVPYVACTDAQLARRKAIQNSGTCPQPVTAACTDYMMRNGGAVNPAETIAAKDPGDGNEWADPSCTQIPCKLKDKPDSDMPPAFDPKTFQQELAKIRADAKAEGDENTYVDLGNNRYGVVTPDGKVRACGPNSCNGKPLDVSKYPGLADKIQAAKSLNSGDNSINADNPDGNMNTKSSPPPVDVKSVAADDLPGDDGAGDSAGDGAGNPGGGSTGGAGGTSLLARSLGAGIANDQANLAKGFGATGAGGAGGGAGGGATVASLDPSVIKVDGATIKNDGIFTYTRMRKASEGVGTAAGTFSTGKMTGFAAPGSSPGADPQVDPATLGKTKAGANN